jgi:acyl-CoA thioesterase FadM
VTRTSFTISYELHLGSEVAATATTRHAAVNERGRPVRLPGWLAQMGER